jgi:hypothetical protein
MCVVSHPLLLIPSPSLSVYVYMCVYIYLILALPSEGYVLYIKEEGSSPCVKRGHHSRACEEGRCVCVCVCVCFVEVGWWWWKGRKEGCVCGWMCLSLVCVCVCVSVSEGQKIYPYSHFPTHSTTTKGKGGRAINTYTHTSMQKAPPTAHNKKVGVRRAATGGIPHPH